MGGALKSALQRLASAAAALGLTLAAPDALAEPVRILVAAGSKIGLPAERPLRFADNDAKRVRDVMVSLGGVDRDNAFYLVEPSKSALFGAIERAKAVALRHRAHEVTLLFYFSGHGDKDALHLDGERVLVSELSAKLGEVPAGLRIAVTDACRATREKGFSESEPFSISATMIPQASGQVWLHASSDGEAAQESDELQGAIFTQAWLSGLRGAADANGDARVTLDESFAFAHSQTMIRSAKSSGVMQKPEAIVNLHETAPVVLTQTAARMATIALPPGRDTHFLIYSAGAKSVLSELWSAPDRALRLRVPPGRYVVQRRVAGLGGAAQIALAEGEERRLSEGDFSSSTLEVLARKGPDDRPDAGASDSAAAKYDELSAGYDAGWNARAGLVHGPRAGYAYAWRAFALSAGGGAELSGRSLAHTTEDLVSGYGRATLELRLGVSRFTFRAGAGGRAGVLVQTLTPTARAAPGATKQTKSALQIGPEIALGARFAISPIWFVDGACTGSVLFFEQENKTEGFAGVTAALTLGARL